MKKALLLVCLFCVAVVAAQSDSVMYVQGFAFKEGIYLSFEQFRTNSPVPKNVLVSSEDSTRMDYLRMVLSKEWIQWRDTSGQLHNMKVSSLWGYSENKVVYIRYNYVFNRISVIGKICHFTSYETNYMYTGPGTYPNQQYGTPVESMQQYILDADSGRVYAFNPDNMSLLLRRDPQLYNEFSGLRKKQKRDQMFMYLRKYNERHLLYFPSPYQ